MEFIVYKNMKIIFASEVQKFTDLGDELCAIQQSESECLLVYRKAGQIGYTIDMSYYTEKIEDEEIKSKISEWMGLLFDYQEWDSAWIIVSPSAGIEIPNEKATKTPIILINLQFKIVAVALSHKVQYFREMPPLVSSDLESSS